MEQLKKKLVSEDKKLKKEGLEKTTNVIKPTLRFMAKTYTGAQKTEF